MNEIIFKILLTLLVISMNSIRFYFQKRYKITHAVKVKEKASIRERLMVLLMFFALAVPGMIWLFTPLLSFGQFYLPDILRIVGFLIGAYAMWLFYYVHKILGDNWSPVLEIRKDHALVVAGPYKWIRHPMYSDMILWLVSFVMITANWFYAITISTGLLILFIVRIPDEEKLMIEQFGEQYKAYMKRTRRLIPFLY
ncbi:MAG: protein-S-isoprenylcysteine O-methyltransferase [Bacteroidota bacterium]